MRRARACAFIFIAAQRQKMLFASAPSRCSRQRDAAERFARYVLYGALPAASARDSARACRDSESLMPAAY